MAGKNYKTGIILTGDSKGAVKAVEGTDTKLKHLNSTGKRTSKSMKEVGESAKSMAKNVAAVGAAAATAAAAYVIHNAGQIKQQQMYADAIGVSSQSMSSLAYASRDTIVTQEKLGDILKDTSEKIGDYIVTGGGAAADTLDRLNLSAKDLAGLSPDQQLLKIAGALDQVGTKSEKIFLLENLASDASLLLPVLEDGATGLRAAQKEAVALGISLSDIDSSMVAQSSSDFGRLTSAAGGFGNILTAEVMPVFGAYAGMVVDSIVQTDSLHVSTLNLAESIVEMVSDISWVFKASSAGFGAMEVDVVSAAVALKKAKYELVDGSMFVSDETQVKYLQEYMEAFNYLGELEAEQANRVDAANEDMSAGIRARIADYKLEAQFKQELIDLGFTESTVIGDTTGQTNEKTEAQKAAYEYQKEQDAAWIKASKSYHAEYRAELEEDARIATELFTNTQNSQWDADNRAFDKLDAQDALLAQSQEMADSVDQYGDAWTRTGDKALDALGSMLSMMDKVGANDKEYADQMQAMRSEGLDQTKEFTKLEEARAKNSISGSLSMLDASVAMYEEGSAAQQAAHNASLVFHAIQMAMDIQKAISAATVAVVTQGEGEPYSAWARIAAMSVMMGGLLSQIGASFGGASGSTSASYDQITQSDSGVLGGGQSNALGNLSEKLQEVNADQYSELRDINKNTKFMSEALTSATGALYSTGDITGLSADLSGFEASGIKGMVSTLYDPMSASHLLGDGIGNALDKMDIGGGLISGLFSSVFGGGTKTTSQGYGLNVGGSIGNVGTSGYQSMKKRTDGGWFGKSKTSYYDVRSGVSPQVSKAINDTFNYVGDSLTEFGDLLDINVSGMVDDLRVTTGKIGLSGKSSAAVQDALTNAINIQSDKWAYELFSEVINQYQALNESAFDTLSRLSIDQAVVGDILETTGQDIGTNMVTSLVKTGEETIKVADEVSMAWWGFTWVIKEAVYEQRNLYKSVTKEVKANAVSVSEALINVAGGLEILTDAAAAYYDNFYSDAEKQQRLYEQLTGAMSSINLALPETSEGYRSLVESFNLGTESGQQAYVTMLKLSDSASSYYDELESLQQDYLDAQIESANTQIDLVTATISAYQSLSDALQSTYNTITGGSSASSMDYMSAQSALSGALDGARNGSIPELSSIQDALSVVGQNSTAGYASYEDYQRDQMTTAGMIDGLIGYTDAAISVEDSMLSELEKQTALLNGVDIVGTANGSHATGIARIPFDGYLAETHKDEAIIDARTMQGLRKYGVNTGQSNNSELVVEVKAMRMDMNRLQSENNRLTLAVANHVYDVSGNTSRIYNDGISVLNTVKTEAVV